MNLFNNAAQLASYPYIYDGEFEHSIKYDLEKMLLFYALSRFFLLLHDFLSYSFAKSCSVIALYSYVSLKSCANKKQHQANELHKKAKKIYEKQKRANDE